MLLALLATTLALADPLPPKVLYHMGQKPHLLEDDRLGTIPPEVWERNIMGRGTRFGLVPYRRGLYGGEEFDNLELYANAYLGTPNGKATVPWTMKIVIKDECRQPDAVSDLATDQKYLRWLLANVNYVVQNASFCLNAGAQNCAEVIIGTQPIGNGREENACDDVMQKFMKDENPRVVIDTEWGKSWYLRDRSCIEKLEASPGVTLETLADAKWDWQSRKSTHSGTTGGGYGMSAMSMLIGALADSESVPAGLLAKLRAKTAASDIHLSFDAASPLWIAEAGPAVLDAYQRCADLGAGGREKFRGYAKEMEGVFHQVKYANRDETVRKITGGASALCD